MDINLVTNKWKSYKKKFKSIDQKFILNESERYWTVKVTVFWLEGVMLTATSIIGIIGNSITIAVLNRISLNNVFNQVRINAYLLTIVLSFE